MLGRRSSATVISVFAALVVAAPTLPAVAQEQGAEAETGILGIEPTVVADAGHDTSPPLSELEPIWVPRRLGLVPEPGNPLEGRRRDGTRGPVGPLAPAGGTAFPAPSTSFAGIANVDNAAQGQGTPIPPDTQGDVGPNHYLQVTNVVFEIFDKAGTSLLGPLPNNTIWAGFGGPCQNTNDGDPIALYDHLANRWLFTQFASPNFPSGPHFQCLAVSKSPDPTNQWHRYAFKWSNRNFNDYPKFGVWPDGYYMTVNQFDTSSFAQPFVGVGTAVFERRKMLKGKPAKMVAFDLASKPKLYSLLPADLDGPPPPGKVDPPFVQMEDDLFAATPRDRLRILELDVNWRRPHRSRFRHKQFLPTHAFDSFLCGWDPCVPQPAPGAPELDTISDRLMFRLQYRNLGTHEAMVVNHTVDIDPGAGDRAGVRWYELRRGGGSSWSIHQQGTYGGDDPDTNDEHRWMGSIAMDGNGDIALGYSVSNGNPGDPTFPSIRYAGRIPSDPLGELGPETSLIEGAGAQLAAPNGVSRWGDYSMMSVDPTDDCTFWYTTEYYAATSQRGWATQVGAFGAPAAPDTSPPGTVVMVQPGRFQRESNRVRATWRGTDCQSGVDTFDVRAKVGGVRKGFGPWQAFRTGTAQTGGAERFNPGSTVCFDVRATDAESNTSPRSPRECTIVPANNTSLNHQGPWTRRRGNRHYRNSYSYTSQEGAALVKRGLRAESIAIVGTRCRGCGKLRVSWSGDVLKTINLRSKRTQVPRVVRVADFGRIRKGSLRIEVVSPNGKRIRIGGVAIGRV